MESQVGYQPRFIGTRVRIWLTLGISYGKLGTKEAEYKVC